MSAYKPTDDLAECVQFRGQNRWNAVGTPALVEKEEDIKSSIAKPSLAHHRGSYSSVKEDNCSIAQSFVTSPLYDRARFAHGLDQVCFEDEAACSDNEIDLPLSLPWPPKSSLEKLPFEILDQIVTNLSLDVPPTDYAPRNIDLIACLQTSKILHATALTTLYRHVTIPHAQIFVKFFQVVSQFPNLGRLVHRLDLSHYNPTGLSRTESPDPELTRLTSKTLLKCLNLLPAVREVLLQQYLQDDLDQPVLEKLLFGLSNLQALDLCACIGTSFSNALSCAVARLVQQPQQRLSIRRLGLHRCSTLPGIDIELLISRLPRLTHLDLYLTKVTNALFDAIPRSARLTHLSLGRCTLLSGRAIVNFIAHHPAASELISLDLSSESSAHVLVAPDDVLRLLEALPPSLRSLNLNGAHVVPAHVPQLSVLARRLEELGLAHTKLSLADVAAIINPPSSTSPPVSIEPLQCSSATMGTAGIATTTTIAATTTVADPSAQSAPSILPPLLPPSNPLPSTIRYLDLTGVALLTPNTLVASAFSSPLLTPTNHPLEVIELAAPLAADLRARHPAANARLGWLVRDCGRRAWYVRDVSAGMGPEIKNVDGAVGQAMRDDGSRAWKMGARWWGRRKVPMAWGETGGLYGHYMFKM